MHIRAQSGVDMIVVARSPIGFYTEAYLLKHQYHTVQLSVVTELCRIIIQFQTGSFHHLFVKSDKFIYDLQSIV